MSFFSFSSGRRPYRNPNYGSSHYQKKGLFGALGSLIGSFSSRSGHYYHQGGGYPQGHYPPGQPHQPLYTSHLAQSSSFCPVCGAQVPAGSKFCLECGAKIMSDTLCPGCGQPVAGNAKFYPNCGMPRK